MGFNREELYLELCKDLRGTYIEVGTCWGSFSKFIIKHLPYSVLFCVDPYRIFEKYEYIDALNVTSQENLNKKFNTVNAELTRLSNGRCKILRVTSQQAASFVKDDSAAFVYIDANHEYKHVKEDILIWSKKVKPGGILAGDDVESMELRHNSMGNVTNVFKSGAFNVCGVHKALIDIRAEHPWFDYTIHGSQFVWRKTA
jgi:hypothetical protein